MSPKRATDQPIGIDSTAEFSTNEIQCDPGERILLMTDGIVEQPSPDGDQFGMDRVKELLSTLHTPEDDVSRLVDEVRAFAATDALADDTTVASIGLTPS